MKIICIGRNYASHISELQNATPEEPVFFLKPDTALPRTNEFYIPSFSGDIHHEIELVYRVCREGKNIAEEFAMRYVDAMTVGIDFTARDIQQKQKEKGLPWEPAKAFDNSAPVGEMIPVPEGNKASRFSLSVNGRKVQSGDSSMMLHQLPQLIAHVSRYITFRKGDLLFTGTPAGVGPVKAGDVLEGFLEDRQLLRITVR